MYNPDVVGTAPVRPNVSLVNLFTALLCLVVGVLVQSLVMWVAAKLVRLVCTFGQAVLIAVICNLLTLIPVVGIFMILSLCFLCYLANGSGPMRSMPCWSPWSPSPCDY